MTELFTRRTAPRGLHRLAILAIAALTLSACSASDEETGSASGETTSPASDTTVVEHAMGETEVPLNPERIVTSSPSWFDTFSALDQPVTLNIAAQQHAEGTPWNDSVAEETISYDGAAAVNYIADNLEEIASSDPDVIFAGYIVDQETYDRLSEIAPTVGVVGGGVVDDWREVVDIAGKVTGQEDRAAELVDGVNEKVSDTIAAHPGLDGATAAFGQISAMGLAVVTSDTDPANELLTDLGLVIPENIKAAGQDGGRAFISPENISLLDTDLLIMWPIGTDPSEISGWNELSAVRNGTLFTLEFTPAYAFGTPSVSSVPWALDQLEQVFTALDGVRAAA